MGYLLLLEIHLRNRCPQHGLGSQPGHGYPAHLRNDGNRPGGPGVGLQHIDRVFENGILYVHQPHHFQFDGNTAGVLPDCVDMLGRQADGGYHAGRIPGMDTGQLDMFHHGRDKSVGAVGNGIGFHLDGVVQKLVDEHRLLRGNLLHSGTQVTIEHLVVVNDFHASAAKDIRRPDHEGVTDALGDFECLVIAPRHARFGLGNPEPAHNLPETIPVFGQVDCFRGGP